MCVDFRRVSGNASSKSCRANLITMILNINATAVRPTFSDLPPDAQELLLRCGAVEVSVRKIKAKHKQNNLLSVLVLHQLTSSFAISGCGKGLLVGDIA